MNQRATLKQKKVLNMKKKGQSPIKTKGFDVKQQFRSSAKLLKHYQIKKKKLIRESNHVTMLDQTLKTHKRKSSIPSTLDAIQGQNKLNSIQAKQCTQKEGLNRLPIHKTVIQSRGSSQMQDQSNDKEEAVQPSKVDGTKTMTMTQLDASIQEQPNPKKIQRKSTCPTMKIDDFLEKQEIHVEEKQAGGIQLMDEGVRSMDSDSIDEEQPIEHELFHNDCSGDQVMGSDCVEGTSFSSHVLNQEKETSGDVFGDDDHGVT